MTEFDHSYLCNPSSETLATFESGSCDDVDLEKSITPTQQSDSIAESTTPRLPKGSSSQRGLGYALKNLFFSGRWSQSDEHVNPFRKAQRFRVQPGVVRCLIAPLEQQEPVEASETAPQSEASSVSDEGSRMGDTLGKHGSPEDKRVQPRLPGNSLFEVVVVPRQENSSESSACTVPALLTPIRGSVVILNRNGISLSLNAPLTVGCDVDLHVTHATFGPACRLAAKVLRREQSRNLWLVVCSLHKPLSDDQVQNFSQVLVNRDIG